MTAPQWPQADLEDLYRLFQTMRQTSLSEGRRRLAFQCVLHEAAMTRMKMAVERFRKSLDRRPSDLDDLLQESALRLVRILMSETLSYRDLGLTSFAGWYWTVCKHVVAQAAQKFLIVGHGSVEELEEAQVPVVYESPELEIDWDDVALVITRIRSPLLQAVLVDAAAGIPEAQTAREYDISISYVSRLRTRGIELVRRACRLALHH